MKKTASESFGSEYCMSAGDNAASRKQINASIVSKATANEHSFREAVMAGLEENSGEKAKNGYSAPPAVPPKS
ncbi:MAG: hypothetical protein P4N41_24035 [Negativicutes bacterium]|nr:hypothetical protein [Negativicutes bacterium]